MPKFEELTELTATEVRQFSSEAKEILREFQDAGWRGYRSNNGHAIMLAPDGRTTASISGHTERGQGKAARRELHRWQRAQLRQAASLPTTTPTHIKGVVKANGGEKPFRCDFPNCGAEFATTQHASLHRQRKHDGLTCPECGKHFPPNITPAIYREHREKEHGVVARKKKTSAAESEPVKESIEPTVTLTSEEDAREQLTRVLAILAPTLLGDIERLRRERDQLQERVNKLEQEASDNDARMALLREALGA